MLNTAEKIFKYNTVSDYYKLESRFLHLTTLSRHLDFRKIVKSERRLAAGENYGRLTPAHEGDGLVVAVQT